MNDICHDIAWEGGSACCEPAQIECLSRCIQKAVILVLSCPQYSGLRHIGGAPPPQPVGMSSCEQPAPQGHSRCCHILLQYGSANRQLALSALQQVYDEWLDQFFMSSHRWRCTPDGSLEISSCTGSSVTLHCLTARNSMVARRLLTRLTRL